MDAAVAVSLISSAAALLWLSHAIAAHAMVGVTSYGVAAGWLASLAVVVGMARRRDRAAEPRLRPDDPVAHTGPPLVLAVSILVAGFVFRSAELDRLPWGYAGINIDGAYNSEVAFRILDGQQPFTPVVPSMAYLRDAMIHYYLAAFYAVGGRNVATLRFACNALAIFDCALLFLLLRRYTTSSAVVLGATAVYAFSSVDAVFAMSGMEYVMTTPFILGPFLLFERARRLGTFAAAALAGVVWGLGVSSHYPYLFLVPILPVIGLVHFRSTRRWLATFLVAGLAAALPKLCYLAFNSHDYVIRFFEVARHDTGGRFLVSEHFWLSLRQLGALLFAQQAACKTLLPADPVITRLQVPFLVVGLGTALLRFTRPAHLLALAVTAFSLLVNFGAFVQDYRVMNAMPIVFFLIGIGLLQLERVLGSARVGRLAVGVVTAVLVVTSIGAYFTHTGDPEVHFAYGTDEVALARSLGRIVPAATPYVLAPHLSYRSVFFNLDHPRVNQPNWFMPDAAQVRYDSEGAARVIANVQQVLREEAGHGAHPVAFVLSSESPYADAVQTYLTRRGGAQMRTAEVTNPVSHRRTLYRLASVAHPTLALAQGSADDVTFSAAAGPPAPAAVGSLSLTTFADTEQVLVVDERQVPATLDFDFEARVPYPGSWKPPFSLRWVGYLRAEKTDEYRLEATFDDGCRVFIDGHLLFADWAAGASRTASSSVRLEAGWHPLRIDYFQLANEARLSVRFGAAPASLGAVPATALAAAVGDATGPRDVGQRPAVPILGRGS